MKKLFFTLIAFVLMHFAASACTASFTYSVNPSNPLSVSFSNTSTFTLTTYSLPYLYMNYGDGSTGVGYSSTHTYAASGTYTVWAYVTVLDSLTNTVTCSDSISQAVTVSYTSCYTTFTSSLGTNGSVTFVANNPAATPGLLYDWDFGDGSAHDYTGPTVTHTYAANSTYNATLTTSDPSNCTHTDTHIVAVGNIINCAALVPAFTSAVNYLFVNFTNTSSSITTPTAFTNFVWDYGDGSLTTNNYYGSHTYSAPGTYTVTLTATVTDSFGSIVYCTNSTTGSVTVANPPSDIHGYITFDSTLVLPSNPIYKVWLIADDTMAHTLTAVDSQNVAASPTPYIAYYAFSNPASGLYLVKAMLTNGPTSGTTLVPTYSYSSLYWNGSAVNVIPYGGSGASGPHDIYMQTGTYTAGPGFVGGSVFAGANKGTHTTGAPVAGMIILLEDASNNAVGYAVTDVNGSYSFSNIAVGTYRVYPEALGYETTPWSAINVTAAAQNQINFQQHTVSKTITPSTSGVVNVINNTDINIFPNPTNGIVNLSWNKALNNTHVTVTDVIGRTAMQTDLNLSNAEGRTQLNLSSLEAGVYFISVQAGNMSYNTKIVLQR